MIKLQLNRNMYYKIIFIFMASLSAYLMVGFSIVIFLFCKYYFADIKFIEPKTYSFNEGRFQKTTGHTKTAFNTFYCHINAFGARNLFEVSREDKNIIILLGDSHFFGVGLNDNETVSYFLNQIDQKRKYINLASAGANVIDSVENYLLKRERINSPDIIVFEVLLRNDICASGYIAEKAKADIDDDYRHVLMPFRVFLVKNKLYRYYINKIYDKIYQDLSQKRFDEYIKNPLFKLIKAISKSNTKIMIISFDVTYKLKNYNKLLRDFCLKNNVYFFNLEDLIDHEYLIDRLPDGHPNVNFNRALAKQLKNKINEIASN